MPRTVMTTEPSRVYVGMLIVSCLAMLTGILLLALEASEYGWAQNPPAAATPPLPPPPTPEAVSWLAEPTGTEVAEEPAAPRDPLPNMPVARPLPAPPPTVAAETEANKDSPRDSTKGAAVAVADAGSTAESPKDASPAKPKPEKTTPLLIPPTGPIPSPLRIP